MSNWTHNPFDEAHWVSRLRENLTSGSYGEGLETGRAWTQVPRQSFTRQVTFQEARAHLGVETQRQWSRRAIAHTTPLLLGLFSIVTLIADRLITGQAMPVRPSAWYRKTQPTFSDALALVRRHLWSAQGFCASHAKTDHQKSTKPLLAHFTELLCYAA